MYLNAGCPLPGLSSYYSSTLVCFIQVILLPWLCTSSLILTPCLCPEFHHHLETFCHHSFICLHPTHDSGDNAGSDGLWNFFRFSNSPDLPVFIVLLFQILITLRSLVLRIGEVEEFLEYVWPALFDFTDDTTEVQRHDIIDIRYLGIYVNMFIN